MKRILLLSALFSILLSTFNSVVAGELYVDPENGKTENTGSPTSPFRSLDIALSVAGLTEEDTIFLRSGFHGTLDIDDKRPKHPVSITADKGHAPRLGNVNISNSEDWTLNGLLIMPGNQEGNKRGIIVDIGVGTQRITLTDNIIQTVGNTTDWSVDSWNRNVWNGIRIHGNGHIVSGNKIRHVYHALNVQASHSTFEKNLIEYFAGDGIRALGDYSVFRTNTIKNCVDIDDNHDDGIQSFSRDRLGRAGFGEVRGVVLTGNTIINFEHPDQQFRCQLQGIGLFDGMFVDWVIANNLVVVDHWHGITVMGARNVRVENNIVMDNLAGKPGPPFITITRHKDGTQSQNSSIAHNVAASFNKRGFDSGKFPTDLSGVTLTGNEILTDPDLYFENPGSFDFRLKQKHTELPKQE